MPLLNRPLPAQRWQPEQASDVHLEQSTDKDCMRNVAARHAGVRLVGMGYELQERPDSQALWDGATVACLAGDLPLARMAASGFGENAVDALRDAGVHVDKAHRDAERVVGSRGEIA